MDREIQAIMVALEHQGRCSRKDGVQAQEKKCFKERVVIYDVERCC
jgi:hypothetical protein